MLDLWVGDVGTAEPRAWRIDGDLRDDDLAVPELRAVQHDDIEVWLPVAQRALTDWFDSIDERYPSP